MISNFSCHKVTHNVLITSINEEKLSITTNYLFNKPLIFLLDFFDNYIAYSIIFLNFATSHLA